MKRQSAIKKFSEGRNKRKERKKKKEEKKEEKKESFSSFLSEGRRKTKSYNNRNRIRNQ